MNNLKFLLYILIFSYSSLFGGIVSSDSIVEHNNINPSSHGGSCSSADTIFSSWYPQTTIHSSMSSCNSIPTEIPLNSIATSCYTYFSYIDYTCTQYNTVYNYRTLDRLTKEYECNFGTVLDEVLNECVICPNDNTVLLVEQGMCSGSMTVNNSRYVDLYWQTCDSTCRGVYLNDLSCPEVEAIEKDKCNLYLNNFTFDCSEPPLSYTSDCIRKVNPCDTEYNLKVPLCEASGASKWLSGFDDCVHNGLYVISSNWQCLDNNQTLPQTQNDCYSNWYEIWNPSTSSCDCETHFVRNSFGNCALPLPVDSTPAEEDLYNKEQQANNNSYEEEKQQDKKDGELQNSLDSQENTLSGVRDDLTETNDLLEDIKKSVDSNSTDNLLSEILDILSVDSNDSLVNIDDLGYLQDSKDILTSVKDGFISIGTDYDNIKSAIDSGFNVSTSSGTSPDISFVFHGSNVNIPICDTFSIFAPILYFIFTILFTVIGIRLFIYGLTVQG